MRSKKFLLLLSLLCVLVVSSHVQPASAQTTIFVSRHTDRGAAEPDPELTPLGKQQAVALAQLLSDANIKHIFTTELIRTQQTASPLAQQIHVTPVVVQQDKFEDLIAQVKKAEKPNESILVVGHRATVPQIVHALTGKDIEPLGSGEYGRLVMITLLPDGSSNIVTLRYAPKS